VRNLLSSHIPKSRYAKSRRVEYQGLIRVVVNLVKRLDPFRVSALRKTREKREIHASRFPESRKPTSTSPIRPVVIAADHMRDFKRERRVCDRLLRI
jgi:hypothetical protein